MSNMPSNTSNKPEIEPIHLMFVLDDLSTIDMDYPEDISEEVMDDMQKAIREKEWLWNCGNWNQLSASYRGLPIDYINLTRVVGIAGI